MWQRKTIMRRDSEDGAQVVYLSDNRLASLRQVFYMPREQYVAMEEPETITLTVQTGDRLNEPGEKNPLLDSRIGTPTL